jgi:carbohydrate diacid regulator
LKGRKATIFFFLLNELPDQISRSLTDNPDHICRSDSFIYYYNRQCVLRFADDEDGNTLLDSILQNQSVNIQNISKTADIYRQILNDSLPESLHENLRDYGIVSDRKRCIVILRSFIPQKDNMYEVFFNTIPVMDHDVIVPIRFDTVALIKDLAHQEMEDIAEYSSAVINTLEEEGIGCIKAGISNESPCISSLRNAYLEASKAIDLGIKYHGDEKVYKLSELTLETIIESIPAEKREEIRRSFIQVSENNDLSGELLETVRVFFLNDLNLTATAKQLYIHRNTLNYRLDKIRKLLHLDVRSFRDAVVFKIITDFPVSNSQVK